MPSTATPIRAGTPLLEQGIRAVNFFNGRLVTQGDLTRDQEARREGDARLGQAVGGGVVRGLEVHMSGPAAERRLSIKSGLAVNPAGQTLCLGADQVLALVPQADEDPPATSGGFGACTQLSGGTYVAGDGLYLVTLAPASRPEGLAPVLALEPGNLRCNTDVIVEAVQLRLLRIGDEVRALHGLDTNVNTPQAISKLRSKVAAACFGLPRRQAAHTAPGVAPALNLLEDMRERGLGQCDVPLAVVFLTAGTGLEFVDRWAVRRRIAAATAAPGWATWVGEPMEARAQAQLAQFQEHLDELPVTSLTGQASEWFAWLPPAGFLRARGTTAIGWQTFLGTRKPARSASLAAGDAPAVLAEALRRDSIDLSGGSNDSGFRVYEIGGGPSMFVRNAPNARHAAEVWFDAQRADMPGAWDVQDAIEKLWGRSCAQMVVRAGMSTEDVRKVLEDKFDDHTDLMLCIEAGDFDLHRPWHIKGLRHVVIQGHGPGSMLSGRQQAALIVEACDSLEVRSLTAEGLAPRARVDDQFGLGGALTIIDVPEVHLSRVHTRGGADEKELRATGILVAHRQPTGTVLRTVVVEDCVLDVKRGQQGLACIHCGIVTIRGNLVQAADPERPMYLGIVVAGAQAGEVQVQGNVVRLAEQGIKVALSTGDGQPHQVEHLVLAHNRVQVHAAEGSLGTDNALCFGLGVGNADSVLVRGNRVEINAKLAERVKTAPGLHLHGIYGPRLLVLENHISNARGFAIELKSTGTPPTKEDALWALELNISIGVAGLLDPANALDAVIHRRKNLPV